MAININTYCRINQNGSININTDPRFGVISYSTNLTVYCVYNFVPTGHAINSISISGGPAYIIKQGTFPVYDSDPNLYGHHFGGTSMTISESNNATILIYLNGTLMEGSCVNPITGTYTWNYSFTENDNITIIGNDCGG
jgi:hypothetical protein